MAFLENGSPVATKLGPIATLNTTIAGKASVTSIFSIANTTRTWLLMPQLTAGTYNCVTSTGTAILFVYDTNNDLLQEINVTSTAASTSIASDFNRIEIEASGALDISITPSNAKITTAGGTMVLDRLSTGNLAATSGGTAGNYTPGQYAHVVLVGGGGGGGGRTTQSSGVPRSGNGGVGGVAATTTAFALTGTYAIVAGAGGTEGNTGSGSPGNVGGTGGASTGFSLTANGGAGGNGAGGSDGNTGAAGTPSGDPATDIYNPATRAKLLAGAAGSGGRFNPVTEGTSAGQAGKVLVLRWTP
jgi:hypothetical protein